MKNEVGRELKVSELRPRTIVWVRKNDHAATMWVTDVSEDWVCFWAGETHMSFLAMRIGPDREQITDETHIPMQIHEYLGAP